MKPISGSFRVTPTLIEEVQHVIRRAWSRGCHRLRPNCGRAIIAEIISPFSLWWEALRVRALAWERYAGAVTITKLQAQSLSSGWMALQAHRVFNFRRLEGSSEHASGVKRAQIAQIVQIAPPINPPTTRSAHHGLGLNLQLLSSSSFLFL